MGNLKTRLTIGLLSLGYVLTSVLFVCIAAGWFVPIDYFDYFLIDLNNRWILGLVFFLIFVLTFPLLINSFRSKSHKLATIHQTALGQIEITLTALQELILHAVQEFAAIEKVKPNLKLTNNKLAVLLEIKLNPGFNIPQIAAELQHVVKDYLAKTAGTSFREIKIHVTQINLETQASLKE